jgi:hypothetical protein
MELLGTKLSDDWRAMMLQAPAMWHGTYDTDVVTVTFEVGCGSNVPWISVTTRGDHIKAQVPLRTLAQEKGWVLQHDFE